jgi:MycE methyltransferase N-terminal/Methyltransferase domain
VDVPVDDNVLSELIRAAGGGGDDVRDLVRKAGLARVAPALIHEVTFRSGLPRNEDPILIQVVLTDQDETTDHHLLAVRDQPVRLAGSGDGITSLRLTFDAAELARELFGPPRERPAGLCRTELWPAVHGGTAPPPTMRDLVGSSFLAIEAVMAGFSAARPDLGELAVRYQSDKWGGLHWFTPHYDRHFRDLRNEAVRVLEIGIGGYSGSWGGGSLKMWKRYFPRGLVYGLDVFDKSDLDEPRITTLRGDQNDPDQLVAVAERHGPFDIVIDDGSHVNEHVLTSFRALLPHVRPGGFYVVEDLWTTYCPGYGGAEDRVAPPTTSVGLLKGLLDGLQYEEHPPGGPEPSYSDTHVVGVHAYHNIAFVEKGRNAEGRIPAWVPRSYETLMQGSPQGFGQNEG